MDMPKDQTPVMGPVEWALLVVLSLLWGGSFFFTEVAVTELPPATIVAGRVGLATVALLILVHVTGHAMPREPGLWGAFLVMGAIGNLIPFSLIVWGQTHVSGSLASILNATSPLFTVVLAHFLTHDEKLTRRMMGGVVAGLVGVTVMIGGDGLSTLGLDVVAQLAIVGAALSYGFAGIYGRRFKAISPMVTAAGQVTATTAMALPIALVVDRPWTLPAIGLGTWGAVVGLALLSTAAAYMIFFRILARAGVTNVMLVTFLIPVSAILLGVTLLGEQLQPKHLAGMALIAVGLALARRTRPSRRPSSAPR